MFAELQIVFIKNRKDYDDAKTNKGLVILKDCQAKDASGYEHCCIFELKKSYIKNWCKHFKENEVCMLTEEYISIWLCMNETNVNCWYIRWLLNLTGRF